MEREIMRSEECLENGERECLGVEMGICGRWLPLSPATMELHHAVQAQPATIDLSGGDGGEVGRFVYEYELKI